ncbi:MAG: glycosyl hydrolase, partial [Candidatus Hinthialibacter sp.]
AAAKGIFSSQIKVKGPQRISQTLPFPPTPQKSPKGPDGLPAYHSKAAVLAIPDESGGQITDFNSIIDLTDRCDPSGRLQWNAPAGDWIILRLVCACTGEKLVLPSPKSDGLIIDHFDPDATALHFNTLIERLQNELGDLSQTALKYLYLPSYEVASYEKEKGLVWAPRLREEFHKKRGYDPAPYLPLLFGFTTADQELYTRFLFDFQMTLSDLIIEGHYQKARQICNDHGLLLCSEAGGPGQPLHNCPFEALRALGSLDVPRGEFWYDHQRFDENGVDILWLVKEIACASHIYGKTIVDGEAFTSWHHWQNGPFILKPLADRALCGGLNRFTFHTGAHSPPSAGMPGWAYHAGTHINVNRVWWPKIKPFIDYLARCCFLLQQGNFVGDVCYYYGDQAPNFVKPKHIDPSLGYGFDYDVINTEAALTRLDVQNKRLVLPDGTSYELYVLPERDDINLTLLQKLEELARKGATIVGPKPTRSNGLHNFRRRDAEIRRLADRLWGKCDGQTVFENQYGQGRFIWGRSLRDILQEKGIGPDFSFTSPNESCDLDFIHRKTPQADIYFVSNKTMDWIQAQCTFRVSGKIPELWKPDTGEIQKVALYETRDGGTTLSLRLPPAGSVFVLFRQKIEQNSYASLSSEITSDQTRILEDGRIEIQTARSGEITLHTKNRSPQKISIPLIPDSIEIDGPWEVRFPEGWGAPPTVQFSKLTSWTQFSDDSVKYFSGIASYHKGFEISQDYFAADHRLYLDLGVVKDIADVSLNGKRLGILWKPPFRLDVTSAARPGVNRLLVEIANQWSNRMVGDALSPGGPKYTSSNITYSIMWKRSWKDTPLQDSGLLGPVRLLVNKKIILDAE